MAPRKKNPLDDVAKTVGNWLGGAARVYADITDRSRDVQPGRAARVQAALDATRAIGKVVDTATGGVGSAVVSDAQRMAKTGSSTPSALYKTAAVNLAAGAVGAGVGKGVQLGARAVVRGAKNLNAPKGDLESLRGLYHGTSQKLKPGTVIRPRAELGVKETWTGAKSNPNVAYATPYAEFAKSSATTSRMTRMNELGFGGGGVSPRKDTLVPSLRGPVRKKVDSRVGGVVESSPAEYNKAVRQTRARVYEVVPVNPSTVKVQKVDKIREYVSPEGFIVKGEVYRSSVYNQTFPRSPSRIGYAIKSRLPKKK